MEGTAQNRGVNYRMLDEVLQLAKMRVESSFDFKLSIFELYNENFRDLLDDKEHKFKGYVHYP